MYRPDEVGPLVPGGAEYPGECLTLGAPNQVWAGDIELCAGLHPHPVLL